jgi:hypothetical protein
MHSGKVSPQISLSVGQEKETENSLREGKGGRRKPIVDSVDSHFTDRIFMISVCLEAGSLAIDCNFHRKVKPSGYMSTR